MSISTAVSPNAASKTDFRVLVPGMPRSASTWLYNAARLLVSQHVEQDFSCGWIGDIKKIPQRQHMVIKTHAYNPAMVEWSTFILYSYRDIRDAVASMARKFGRKPSIEFADNLVATFHLWSQAADFVMPYDAIKGDQTTVINSIGEALGIQGFDPEQIVKDLAALSYDSEGPKNAAYNELNLFHQGHITDGRTNAWDGQVESDLIAEIEDKHRDWFQDHGFPIGTR